MRRFFLFSALALSACSGGSTNALPPSTTLAVPQSETAVSSDAAARAASVVGEGPAVVYLAYSDRIDVYPKNATGSTAPIRSITGTSAISIAVDRFGFLYVADPNSWTIRKYRRDANGAATPLATFTAPYPIAEGAGWTHGVGRIAVRYDGTIAAFVGSADAATQSSHVYFGVFGPNPGTFGIAGTLPDGAADRAITVDGSGDVFLGYDVANPELSPNVQRLVRRFSPHPDGYYDDGIVLSLSAGGSLTCCEALAASGDDRLLEGNTIYAGGADVLALRFSITTVLSNRAPNAAFDAEGRLFFESAGVSYSHPFVAVFPQNLTNGNLPPPRLFSPVIPAGAIAQPFSMAVTR